MLVALICLGLISTGVILAYWAIFAPDPLKIMRVSLWLTSIGVMSGGLPLVASVVILSCALVITGLAHILLYKRGKQPFTQGMLMSYGLITMLMGSALILLLGF